MKMIVDIVRVGFFVVLLVWLAYALTHRKPVYPPYCGPHPEECD